MLTHDLRQDYDLFKFRRFRLNLIGFLKLPLNISETALRDIIRGCSLNLLADYEARAELATLESEYPRQIGHATAA